MLPAISDLLCIPVSISASSDPETTSFEAIQLSAQGAERQRKDVAWSLWGPPFLFYVCVFVVNVLFNDFDRASWLAKLMKVSMRFELLMQQRRLQPDSAELNDNELLGQLISKFNSHKATSALKKWQITGDQHQAMLGIICGLSAAARSLIRSHLDWNKYEQSGSLASSETTSVSFGLILLL